MEMTLMLAKILGAYLTIVGVAMLVNMKHCDALVGDFEAHKDSTALAACFALLFGLFLINVHNVWVMDWPVIITVVAYLSAIKGVVFLFAPQLLTTHHALVHPMFCGARSVINIVIGLFLLYHGYYLNA